MKCPRCGLGELKVVKKNGQNIALCSHCNTPLTLKDLQTLSINTPPKETVQNTKKKKGSCLMTILKTICVLAAFLMGIATVGHIMGRDKTDASVDGVDILFKDSVENDTTGHLRSAKVTTPKDILKYAKEYHDTYFSSDDEIHAIINPTLGTTNKLSMLSPDIMDIQVTEYVDKEERDADTLFSGMLLGTYHLTLSTGEVEEISDTPALSDFSEDIQPMETLIWMIEADASTEKYDGYTLDHDEQTITVNVWQESFTDSVDRFQSEGRGPDDADWMWLKNHIKNSPDYMYDCIKNSHGHEHMTLVFNLLDHRDHARVLLTVVNDAIVYDILGG